LSKPLLRFKAVQTDKTQHLTAGLIGSPNIGMIFFKRPPKKNYYDVVCCLKVYEEMMSCDVELVVIFQSLSQSEQLVDLPD
jgi:hypothetical protein